MAGPTKAKRAKPSLNNVRHHGTMQASRVSKKHGVGILPASPERELASEEHVQARKRPNRSQDQPFTTT